MTDFELPPMDYEQQKYLKGLLKQQQNGEAVVKNCKCRFGGGPGSYEASRKLCPEHKND